MPGIARRSTPLVAGLGIQAGAALVTLILAGRLLGAAGFAGISVLYLLLSSFATGLFLPVEQEIARRRGQERGSGAVDPTLVRRAVAVSMAATAVVCVVAVAASGVSLRLLDGNTSLLAALCVGLPGYAGCFISRGVFAGSGELGRYGLQLGAESVFRLAGVLGLTLVGVRDVGAVGWLFGAAPWIALAASFVARRARPPGAAGPVVRGGPLLSSLGLLLVSSLAAQLLINAGPVIIQFLATPAQRARAGAFLAALVLTRVPVFLFTAVQPSFLPAMATHAAVDRKADFVRLTRRVLLGGVGFTVVSTAGAATVGPALIRVVFGFRQGVGAGVFLAIGLAVGLFLTAMILAQALLGRGLHAWTTFGWAAGLAGMALGAYAPGSAVDRATTAFLLGAVAAACTSMALLAVALRRWNATGAVSGDPHREAARPSRPLAK